MSDKLILDTTRLINTYTLENSDAVNAALINLIRAQGDRQGRKTNVKADMTDWVLPVDHQKTPYNQFFDFLRVSVVDSITQLLKPIDYSRHEPYSYSITSLWGAVYHSGDYTNLHNHFSSTFSFCYYLKMNNPPAPLQFGSGDHSITPTEGMLIIFPGWMNHGVDEIISTDERIVLAGNIAVH
jgi:hypothetical protein